MMNKKEFQFNSSLLFYSQFTSSFGSSFSKYAIPLFIYYNTKDVYHIGLQWSVIALVNLLAIGTVSKINIFKNDKDALIYSDFLLSIFAFIPFFLSNNYPIFSAYIATAFISYLSTFQNAHFEGLVSFLGDHYNNRKSTINLLISQKSKAKHFGTLLGFLLAYLVSTHISFKIAFFIDGLTFLISALINSKITKSGFTQQKRRNGSLKLLFNTKIKNLSIAQIIAGYSVYIVNSVWIIGLKNIFKAPDLTVSIVMVLQYIVAYIASHIVGQKAKRNNNFSNNHLFFIRFSYFLIFFMIALFDNYVSYIILLTIFNFLIPLSMPGITYLFHSSVPGEEVKLIAAARTGVTMLAGAFGAITGAFLIEKVDFYQINSMISFLFLLSSLFFFQFVQSNQKNI